MTSVKFNPIPALQHPRAPRRRHVEECVRTPDATHTLRMGDLELALLTKTVEGKRGPRTLLVCTRPGGSPDELEVCFAYRVATGREATPLEALEALVDSFGLRCRVGDELGTLFLRREVTLSPEHATEVVTVPVRDRAWIASFFFRVDRRDGIPIAACAVVFAIDSRSYLESL